MFTKTDVNFRELVHREPIQLPVDRYDLVITGPVGAGKSTLCEAVHQIIPEFECYPEFIEMGDDYDRLFGNMFLAKKIKDNRLTFTFQSYILDSWKLQLDDKKASKRLLERCVDDSVICFANIDNYNGHITDNELRILFEKCQNINSKYELPTYFSDNIKFSIIESGNLVDNINEVLAIIADDIEHGITQRIIGLQISPKTSLERINKRNRSGENQYTFDQVSKYTNIYSKLFDIKLHDQLKGYLDIGKLRDI